MTCFQVSVLVVLSVLPAVQAAERGTPNSNASIADGAVNSPKTAGNGFHIFDTSMSSTPKGSLVINSAKYNLHQVHWNTPSENTIDGKSFAMEVHFVHQLDDTKLVGACDGLAVIGLLYELGSALECNADLAKLWDLFQVDVADSRFLGAHVDWNAKLQAEMDQGYYHWYGSLTTPPCTEGVSWNLLKRTEKVCPAQLAKLQTALGNLQRAGNPVASSVTKASTTPMSTASMADGANHIYKGEISSVAKSGLASISFVSLFLTPFCF
jgi:carbonic anhydrase